MGVSACLAVAGSPLASLWWVFPTYGRQVPSVPKSEENKATGIIDDIHNFFIWRLLKIVNMLYNLVYLKAYLLHGEDHISQLTMSFKTIPLSIILLFSSVITACIENECPPALPYFEVKGIDVSPVRVGSDVILTTSNPVAWDKLYYRVDFSIEGVAANYSNSSGNLFALDCIFNGYRGSKIGIVSLSIRPLTAYSDADTPDSFSSSLYQVRVINELVSIQEFNLIFREGYDFQEFDIQLSRAPKSAGEIQQFEIELTFANGKTFKQTTTELRILN